MVIIVSVITAKITPRAMNSLFNFNAIQNTTKSNTVPKVIIFPNLPSACNNSIPVTNVNFVNSRTNKKHPKKEVIIPIINPSSSSVLFFKRVSN
jgi:hypothetical protein